MSHRENNFNLIRLLLAALVVVGHSPELIDGDRHREPGTMIWGTNSFGELAVNGFFILSGYLIALSWLRAPELKPYFLKRLLRIVPGFVVASLASAAIAGPLGTNPEYWRRFQIGPFLRGLATLGVPKVPAPFVGWPYPNVNSPIWTIRYEAACYALVAALGVAGLLLRRRLVLMLTACMIVLHTMISANWLPTLPALPAQGGDQALRLVACFLGGSCLALFPEVRFTPARVLCAGGLLFLALFNGPLGALAIPTIGAYALIGSGLARPVPYTGAVRREDVSYGLYLYAWPIAMLILVRWTTINPWLLSAITLALAIPAGWLSWRLVERPALTFKRRSRAVAPVPAST